MWCMCVYICVCVCVCVCACTYVCVYVCTRAWLCKLPVSDRSLFSVKLTRQTHHVTCSRRLSARCVGWAVHIRGLCIWGRLPRAMRGAAHRVCTFGCVCVCAHMCVCVCSCVCRGRGGVPLIQKGLCISFSVSACKSFSMRACKHEHSKQQVSRVGQHRIYTPYMTVCKEISLPKKLYIHRTYITLPSSTSEACTACAKKSIKKGPHGQGVCPWHEYEKRATQ